MKELILRVIGSYPIQFIWGGKCGEEKTGGLTIIQGDNLIPNAPLKNNKFIGGGVMHRKDARKLMELIKEGLDSK